MNLSDAEITKRKVEALAYYRLLKKTKQLKSVLLAEYRCDKGCLLMAMYRTPDGVAMYHQRWNELPEIRSYSYVQLMNNPVVVDGVQRWDGGEGDHRRGHWTQGRCRHLGAVSITFDDKVLGTPGNPTRRIVNNANKHSW